MNKNIQKYYIRRKLFINFLRGLNRALCGGFMWGLYVGALCGGFMWGLYVGFVYLAIMARFMARG